jgi:hypothetical protein
MKSQKIEIVDLGDAKHLIQGIAEGNGEGSPCVANQTSPSGDTHQCPGYLSDFDEEE